MFGEIMLHHADGTSKNYGFCANGATSIRYRQLFKKELMAGITGIITSVGTENLKKLMEFSKKMEESDDAEISIENTDPEMLQMMISIVASGEMDTVSQLAFIMNKQAEHANMNELNIEKYLEWIEQFGPTELLGHAMDIIGLYTNNQQTSSTAKKNTDQLTGK